MTTLYRLAKRCADFAVAGAAILLSAPVVAVAALLIWREDRSASPFLRQERIGRNERPFLLIKLRTMRTERFRDGCKLTDAQRMLRCGAWLRKFSIDELPQLVNVLMGDMSLIGPRPMPVVYLDYFRPDERLRHVVRPGMSGLAQVSGRNLLSWDDKFALDVRYVQEASFRSDVVLLMRTVMRVLRPTGVGVRGADLPVASLHEVRADECRSTKLEDKVVSERDCGTVSPLGPGLSPDHGWMHKDRWEHGSYPALPDPVLDRSGKSAAALIAELKAACAASGRVALGRIIAHGRAHRGWQRILVPTYYCTDVVSYLEQAGIEVARYACSPCGEDIVPAAQAGDVLLRVNFFGWGPGEGAPAFGGDVIADFTHDLLAARYSTADFAIASLRKVLPVSDGGIYWSPQGHGIPAEPSSDVRHQQAALAKLAAMALKRAYLEGVGSADDKVRLRELEQIGEEGLLNGHDAAISRWARASLADLFVGQEAAARRTNACVLRNALHDAPGLAWRSRPRCQAPAFAVLQLQNEAMREHLRAALVARRIYPAVLWPVAPTENPLFAAALRFSRTCLMLHIDRRYDKADMQHVAAQIREICVSVTR